MIYPWLQNQWQQLLSQYQQQRLPQALLIEGPAGLGKLALAQHLAALVLCEKSGVTSCGICRGCVLKAAKNHPDYYVLQPEEEAKNIKIEAVRELTLALSQHSHRAGYQIAIIEPAEKMNRAAANALLKTLEEPAGQVLMILVTNQSSALPATVLSRCQRIVCAGTDAPETEAWLARELQNPTDAALLLQVADYAPLQALRLAETDYLNLRKQRIFQLVAFKTGQLSLAKLVADWTKADINLLLNTLQILSLDLLRLSLKVEQAQLANADCFDDLLNLYQLADAAHWLKFAENLQKTRALVTAANNLNVQMVLENLLVKM